MTDTCWGHHSSIWLNLLPLSFDLPCITPDVPSRRLQREHALFMILGPPSSYFLFNSGPKKALSLSLDVKCDQQTHKKKWCLKLWHQSQENHPTKFPWQFFRCYLLADKPIKIKDFLWVRGRFYGFGLWEVKILWVWIMGSQNVMGLDYGSNISVVFVRTVHDMEPRAFLVLAPALWELLYSLLHEICK